MIEFTKSLIRQVFAAAKPSPKTPTTAPFLRQAELHRYQQKFDQDYHQTGEQNLPMQAAAVIKMPPERRA
jgi:hypothetical protein